MHRVGQTFADARAEAGLTQTQLAELSGVHQSCLSRLEQGNGNATISTLETVAAEKPVRSAISFIVAILNPSLHDTFQYFSNRISYVSAFHGYLTILPPTTQRIVTTL